MRALVAGLVSVAGTTMVFGVLLSMNREAPAPTLDKTSTPVAMDVARKPKPPKKAETPRTPPKSAPRRPAAPPPPVPIAGGLTAVSLGLPGGDVDFGDRSAAGLFDQVKTSVMTEDSVDSKPRAMRRTAAKYPPRARARGVTGFVSLSLLISERGSVERVKLLRADPPGVFDQVAMEAVKGWQFEPATYGGEPVKVWANQTVRFELK